MSTTIRLTRMGRKQRPFYRLVVLDSRSRRDGAYIANLGNYDPFGDPYKAEFHSNEIIDWLNKGATLSDTAKALLQHEGILYRWSLEKQGMEASEVATKVAEWKSEHDRRASDKKAQAAEKIAAKAKAEADALAEEEAEKAKVEAEAKAAEEAEALAKEEAEKAEAAAEEAAAAAAEEAPAEEAAAEEAPAEEAAAEEAPAEETEDKPAEDS